MIVQTASKEKEKKMNNCGHSSLKPYLPKQSNKIFDFIRFTIIVYVLRCSQINRQSNIFWTCFRHKFHKKYSFMCQCYVRHDTWGNTVICKIFNNIIGNFSRFNRISMEHNLIAPIENFIKYSEKCAKKLGKNGFH